MGGVSFWKFNIGNFAKCAKWPWQAVLIQYCKKCSLYICNLWTASHKRPSVIIDRSRGILHFNIFKVSQFLLKFGQLTRNAKACIPLWQPMSPGSLADWNCWRKRVLASAVLQKRRLMRYSSMFGNCTEWPQGSTSKEIFPEKGKAPIDPKVTSTCVALVANYKVPIRCYPANLRGKTFHSFLLPEPFK